MDKIKPGTSIPARFIGEFDGATFFSGMVKNAGDVALVTGKSEYWELPRLFVRCALCGGLDDLPISRWALTSREPVNIEPSIVNLVGPMPDTGKVWRCHYFVHGGQFQALGDSDDRTG